MKALTNHIAKDKPALLIFFGLLCYVGINVYAMLEGIPWIPFLPAVLVFGAFAFLRPMKFWFFLVLLTPFTVQVDIDSLGSSLTLPNEPFIGLMLVLLLFKFLLTGQVNKKVLFHPLTVIIIFQLVWMFITSMTSSMPLVSFKYLLSRVWFVVVFFFFAIHIFKKKENIEKFIWYISVSLTLLIFYTLFRHWQENFSHKFSYYAALPFFKDHNIYAVVVAFFVPPIVTYALKGKTMGLKFSRTTGYWIMSVIFLVAVTLSYTRAAWVSLGASLVMCVLMFMKVRLSSILGILVLVASIVVYGWSDIRIYLTKNKSESDTDLDQHVQSIYNVTTDDSNTERLNRWSAALRMFEERPIFGWGANTYQFKYAPFQISWQKTRISTNQGDLGNSHSEFIGPLAEMGLLGMLLVLAMVLTAIHRSMLLFYKAQSPLVRFSGLFVTLSLITYYVHGLLNNYLDIDKANVSLWASLAIIVALDAFHMSNGPEKEGSSQDEKAIK